MAKGKINSKREKPRKKMLVGEIFFKLFLLVSSITVAFFLITYLGSKDQFLIIRDQILTNPSDLSARLRLAEIYLENNQFEEAGRELTNLNRQSHKLTEEQKTRLARLCQDRQEKDPQELPKKIRKWQSLLNAYSDYRDGYRQLAFLYLQLGKVEKAMMAIKKALSFSPYNEVTQNLERLIWGK